MISLETAAARPRGNVACGVAAKRRKDFDHFPVVVDDRPLRRSFKTVAGRSSGRALTEFYVGRKKPRHHISSGAPMSVRKRFQAEVSTEGDLSIRQGGFMIASSDRKTSGRATIACAAPDVRYLDPYGSTRQQAQWVCRGSDRTT